MDTLTSSRQTKLTDLKSFCALHASKIKWRLPTPNEPVTSITQEEELMFANAKRSHWQQLSNGGVPSQMSHSPPMCQNKSRYLDTDQGMKISTLFPPTLVQSRKVELKKDTWQHGTCLMADPKSRHEKRKVSSLSSSYSPYRVQLPTAQSHAKQMMTWQIYRIAFTVQWIITWHFPTSEILKMTSSTSYQGQ